MIEVKFGTPKPIPFTESVKGGGNAVVDIDLEARFAAKCAVSAYDTSRYADDEAVIAAIKENGPAIIGKCLENYPEGRPRVRNHFSELDRLFDEELDNYGITAKTEFFSKALTEESESSYKDILKSIMSLPTDCGWDHGMFDTVPKDKPEGFYCVRAGLGFKLKDDRAYYMPGEHVEAVFVFVATDTSYDVEVDAPDLKVEYGSVIKVSFTMPDHDVDIRLGCRSVMMNKPFTPMSGVGMMGMVDNMNNGNKPDRANVTDKPLVSDRSEWICPLCGGKNTGKFCCECGGARPLVSDRSEWTCPLCGGKNTGKFCCECGGARPRQQV